LGCWVEPFEVEEALLKFVELGDVAGIEDLALEDGEVDLRLVASSHEWAGGEVGVGPLFGGTVH
jgi:hypothetical protein